MVKHKPRIPMPVCERAKQFMPFAAVRGLNLALRRKEQELVARPPKIIAEEEAAELDAKLHRLQKGSQATVTYFVDGRYVQSGGRVVALDGVRRCLTLFDVANNSEISVALADIIEID